MQTAIRTENLKKEYPLGNGGSVPVLNGVSVELARGCLTILKGRSGSGKTTLLNMLGALDTPGSGEVYFGEKQLGALTGKEREALRRYEMGFVFQSVALVPVMSAYENLEFALRLADYKGDHDARIRACLEIVGMKKRMDHRAAELSGGEQQRVAIARAIVHRPRVIFADEPTGALDTASALAVMELFCALVKKENVTIVMTTHDPELMRMGDAAYEMRDGKLRMA